jgi:hypothetical protein
MGTVQLSLVMRYLVELLWLLPGCHLLLILPFDHPLMHMTVYALLEDLRPNSSSCHSPYKLVMDVLDSGG